METGVSSEYDQPPYTAGVRFTPEDEELIQYYLLVKINGGKLPCDLIKEENVYAYNPEELAERYNEQFGGNWYFLTPRYRKYAHGSRPNRSAGSGYWKATGSDTDIISRKGKKMGVKKSLTFYLGEQPGGTKTIWLMDEYRIDEFQQPINPESMLLDRWVLCRIHYGRSGSRGATSSRSATNENEADNMIEDSLLVSAEADQPDKTTDNAPALAEVVVVEPINSISLDQFNPSIFAMNSEADQADATTHNPLALPEAILSESRNNIFQDQFNPSTLANFDDSPWDFFDPLVAPSLDIMNDFSFTDQICSDSADQCLQFNSEHLDFDSSWTYWMGEVDDNANLQKSSVDEANTQVQQSGLGDSTMTTQEQQGLGTSTMDTQEQQGLGNSTMNIQKQQGFGSSDENSRAPAQRKTH